MWAKFTSGAATVIAIDMIGLWDCVGNCSPSHLFEALASLYDMFDEVLVLHPAVRRVRYNGGQIIACSGLFDSEDQPADQVEHAALACIEFASCKEDISEKFAIEIAIASGIAFGGPLVGDLLSPGTPAFDVQGDLVEEAIAIRESPPPGVVM
jgi:hypothetical protein